MTEKELLLKNSSKINFKILINKKPLNIFKGFFVLIQLEIISLPSAASNYHQHFGHGLMFYF